MLAEVTGETKSITLPVISSDLDRGEQANWPTIEVLETNSNAKEALACTEENRSQRNIFKVILLECLTKLFIALSFDKNTRKKNHTKPQ